MRGPFLRYLVYSDLEARGRHTTCPMGAPSSRLPLSLLQVWIPALPASNFVGDGAKKVLADCTRGLGLDEPEDQLAEVHHALALPLSDPSLHLLLCFASLSLPDSTHHRMQRHVFRF